MFGMFAGPLHFRSYAPTEVRSHRSHTNHG